MPQEAVLYLPVLHGTLRAENRSAALARYAAGRVEARGHETRLWSAGELALGDLVRRDWGQEDPAPSLQEFVREMGRADGFVLVFPEYNHGYPGAMKNMLDHLYDEWARKPFAFVTAGGVSGGLRAQENLAPVIRAIEGVVIKPAVSVPSVKRSWTDDGPASEPEAWEGRFDAMIDDLAWWAEALAPARGQRGAALGVSA